MNINKQEIEAVSALSAEQRYKYFVKRVADCELMFTLVNKDGQLANSELEGRIMIPFWTASEYADLCKINGWENTISRMITLDDFEEEVIDYLVNNDYLMNIFPVGEKTGFIVDVEEFSEDLATELENYN